MAAAAALHLFLQLSDLRLSSESKIKWAALAGLVLSFLSLIFHLFLAKASTAELVQYATFNVFTEDVTLTVGGRQSVAYRKLWSGVKSLDSLLPYSNPRTTYPGPPKRSNGFIYAKIYGEFGKIKNSIADLVVVSRLLNATLVIPELQESSRSKGISSKYTSFSYLYNVEQFIAALKDDVVIVKSLPAKLKEGRKSKQYPTLKPSSSASASYYTNEVLPLLGKSKVIGLVISDGGCLQNTLPPSLVEYQRLRCRVAFHALSFRNEILALGRRMVQRLRSSRQPYLAYYPGLVRETLAYHGCAELFQDVHTELIQHLRAKTIKQHIINEELSVDSHAQKMDGACPLMPEEMSEVSLKEDEKAIFSDKKGSFQKRSVASSSKDDGDNSKRKPSSSQGRQPWKSSQQGELNHHGAAMIGRINVVMRNVTIVARRDIMLEIVGIMKRKVTRLFQPLSITRAKMNGIFKLHLL
ncbi:EMBRYO SAC DEVELOPMENT ARREST 30-like protein [Drosera capensis]